MKSSVSSGARLARQHAGRFRVVPYGELRVKATELAAQILASYGGQPESIVVAPILMGGGLPARLVIDALLPYGVIREVVPCRIRRYSGMDAVGEAEFTVELAEAQIRGQVVVGVDDLVDGGQTLAAFREHALNRGASEVEEAVIFAKPHSTVVPKYCAERGVTAWLVMPGEEHDFMRTMLEVDEEVRGLPAAELARYFVGLGLRAETIADWQQLQATSGVQWT